MRDYSGMRECASASQTEIVALLKITVLFERRYLENETSYRRDSKSILKGKLCSFSRIKNNFFHGRIFEIQSDEKFHISITI